MSEHVSDSAEWQAVQGHAEKFSTVRLRDLFDSDPRRGERLTARVADLHVDYSKNLVTDEVLAALFALAERARLRDRIAAMFAGELPSGLGRRFVSGVRERHLRAFGRVALDQGEPEPA